MIQIFQRLAFTSLAAFGLVLAAPAATLLSDSFESYATQADFTNSWLILGATPISGTLISTQAVSLPNSVHYDDLVAQRNQRLFTESGLPAADNTVTFSFDFYDTDSAANPYRQYANLQDGTGPSGSGQLISMGLNNNLITTADGGNFYMARILGVNAGAYFKLNDNPSLTRSTGWHNLSVTISDVDFRFFVDGSLAEVVPQGTNILRSYDVVRLGSGLTSTREAMFDNVSVVTAVPEPGTLSLIVLGMGGFFLHRRFRRR